MATFLIELTDIQREDKRRGVRIRTAHDGPTIEIEGETCCSPAQLVGVILVEKYHEVCEQLGFVIVENAAGSPLNRKPEHETPLAP